MSLLLSKKLYTEKGKHAAKEELEKQVEAIVKKQSKAQKDEDTALLHRLESEKSDLQSGLQALQTYP